MTALSNSWFSSVEYVGLMVALSYCLVYWWRTPLFILPAEILRQPISLFGREIQLSTGFSLMTSLSMGLAKIPGTFIMTGKTFRNNRLTALLLLLSANMLCQALGVLLFPGYPLLQLASVFVASFISSWLYGGMFSYLEGRSKGEILMAITMGLLICAGPASRGTARFVLESGVPPHYMPLVIGLVACPISMLFLGLADKSPASTVSEEDLKRQSQRKPVDMATSMQFFATWGVGYFCLVASSVLRTSLRTYRDFFAQDIFTAAMDARPSALFFTLVDVPGGLAAVVLFLCLSRVKESASSLYAMISCAIGSAVFGIAITFCFQSQYISGEVWSVLMGISIYVGYGLMCGAWYDRLVAAARFQGTCTFLLFLSDGLAYVGIIVILFFQIFATPMPAVTAADDAKEKLDLFIQFAYYCSAIEVIALVLALVFFKAKLSSVYTPVSSVEDVETNPLFSTAPEPTDLDHPLPSTQSTSPSSV